MLKKLSGFSDTSTGSHGLVVALKDVSQEEFWGAAFVTVGKSNFTDDADYVSVTTTRGATGTINRMLGYNNTSIIRDYNNTAGNNKVTAVSIIDDAVSSGTLPQVPGTSG